MRPNRTGTENAIRKQIESLGFITSEHRMGEFIELHAYERATEQTKIARVDGDGEEELYIAWCALAEMVGIRLEG